MPLSIGRIIRRSFDPLGSPVGITGAVGMSALPPCVTGISLADPISAMILVLRF